MTDLLRVHDLRVTFQLPTGEVEAVRGLSFRVPPGATVALVGESGSGKSVAALSIMGLLPGSARIASGQILFTDPDTGDTVDLARLNPAGPRMRAIRGDRISIIFQEPMTSLSPLHTIGDQIGEAARLHRGAGTAEARALAREMLGHIGFPDPARALDAYPFELSGGQRQRAMIAMALLCRPALLIADEPTTALDVTIQAQILKLIKDLQSEFAMAVLLITHDLGVVANLAEEVVVLYHGQVMEAGLRDDLFRDPRHPYLRALLGAVPRFHRPRGERLVPLRDIRSRTDAALLRAEGAHRPARTVPPGAPLLDVSGLTKSYGRRSRWFGRPDGPVPAPAVEDASFTIRCGECLGLVGESGSGKTTVSRLLMRAVTPDAGTIVFHDGNRPLAVPALAGEDLMRYRRRVQMVFQDPFGALNPRMTVRDIIEEPLRIHRVGTPAQRRAMAGELIDLVGLDVRALGRYPHSFSGGQRQRIDIARALALMPSIVICDEPVSALDVSIQAQILNLLKDLQERLHLTYLFISHNLAVVDYIADRIMVMCRGRIVEVAPRETLFRDPVHPYTRALLAAVPEPDPNYPLDFARLEEERASDPAAWAAPFAIDADHRPGLLDLGGGHWVRAAAVPHREPARAAP